MAPTVPVGIHVFAPAARERSLAEPVTRIVSPHPRPHPRAAESTRYAGPQALVVRDGVPDSRVSDDEVLVAVPAAGATTPTSGAAKAPTGRPPIRALSVAGGGPAGVLADTGRRHRWSHRRGRVRRESVPGSGSGFSWILHSTTNRDDADAIGPLGGERDGRLAQFVADVDDGAGPFPGLGPSLRPVRGLTGTT